MPRVGTNLTVVRYWLFNFELSETHLNAISFKENILQTSRVHEKMAQKQKKTVDNWEHLINDEILILRRRVQGGQKMN